MLISQNTSNILGYRFLTAVVVKNCISWLKWHVPTKRHFTVNGLNDVVSDKIELFTSQIKFLCMTVKSSEGNCQFCQQASRTLLLWQFTGNAWTVTYNLRAHTFTHLVDNPVKHVRPLWSPACYCRPPTQTVNAGPCPQWRGKHTHTRARASINNVLFSRRHRSQTIMTPKDIQSDTVFALRHFWNKRPVPTLSVLCPFIKMKTFV
jgi:hypothetical protein